MDATNEALNAKNETLIPTIEALGPENEALETNEVLATKKGGTVPENEALGPKAEGKEGFGP